MPHIPLTSDTDTTVDSRADRSARLTVLSGLLMVAGSVLITIAALIKWWPVSPVLLVAGTAVFWTVVSLTAKADPNEVQLDLREV